MKTKDGGLSRIGLILLFVIVIAAAVRIYGITFGLPAVYDPDEPFFTMTGLKLLSGHSLNPGWFGHPGTTTIYVLSLIDAMIYLIGHFSGQFADPRAFGVAIFTNPEIAILPGRLFIALCGAMCVGLTYAVGKRVSDARTGLVGAALLAINPLHIEWSQIIRTDVHATVFMLLCVLCSLGIANSGRLRHYLAAGACVGLAAATKWPAAAILICPLGACLLRVMEHREEAGQQYRRMVLVAIASVIALVIVSPYLVLDYQTAWMNVRGEAAPAHLGASGGNFAFNAAWYLLRPIGGAIGWAGLLLTGVGIAVVAVRNRLARLVVLPGPALFAIIICAQSLIWARWAVPLLPFISLFMAIGIFWLGDLAKARFGRRPSLVLQIVLLVVVSVPMIMTWRSQVTERLNDTRGQASAWIQHNTAKGSSIALEYFAFDMLRDHKVVFPAGNIGCIYANEVLHGGVKYKKTNKWRDRRAILDLGTVDESKLDSCRADYAIFTDYDRYLAEAPLYPQELATYQKLSAGGVLLKTFAPVPGEIGGPVVRIFKLKPPAAQLAS